MIYLETIATIFVFIGVFMIAIPKIQGYYFMSLGQVCWITFGVMNAHYMFLFQSIVLLGFNFWGISNWKKKNVG